MARILHDIGFVHLHVHSSYSLLEGALKIAQLAKLAAADKQPALALTDTNNLFGALEFSEKLAGSGIQPIAGVQLSVCFEEADPVARVVPQPANIVLLAQNEEGYRNLMRLVSHAYFGVPLGEDPRVAAPALVGSLRGTDRADGRLHRPPRFRPARRRTPGSGAGAARHPQERLRPSALCGDPAARIARMSG